MNDMREVMRMPPPSGTFWRSEPRTLLKHQVYRWYLDCWMGKICQTFPRSAVVDCFAGPGSYEDGPEGSPVVIAKTFLDHSHLENFNRFKLITLEERLDRRDALAKRLSRLVEIPKIAISEPRSGSIADHFGTLYYEAHGRDPATPVLWVLDPFDYTSVPFSLVKRCLAGTRNEVLITWFADELYRFSADAPKERAIDSHFGIPDWRRARAVIGESARKEELLRIYQLGLQSIPGVQTGAFSIASKNESARYSLVLATHSDSGLKCFNQMKWRMDRYHGHHVSEKHGINQQPGLFDDSPELSSLNGWLKAQAGKALSFTDLAKHAGRLGYKETHLRSELSNLAGEGLAVREAPLDYRKTPWPADAVIRFYAPPE
jgi:three-Cys-motif partner protein